MARPKLHHKDWKAQEAELTSTNVVVSSRENFAGFSKTSLFPSLLGVIWCDMRRHDMFSRCPAWIQARSIWTCRGHLHDQLSIFREDCWSVIHVVGAGVGHILVRNPWGWMNVDDRAARKVLAASFKQLSVEPWRLLATKRLHYVKFFLGITWMRNQNGQLESASSYYLKAGQKKDTMPVAIASAPWMSL